MPLVEELRSRLLTVRDLFRFLWDQRMWWLIPMVFLLLIVGAVIIFAQGSAVAPFVYTLF